MQKVGDTYYARMQDSWRAGEDVDRYVHRQFELMDDFPTGIVTHRGPAQVLAQVEADHGTAALGLFVQRSAAQ